MDDTPVVESGVRAAADGERNLRVRGGGRFGARRGSEGKQGKSTFTRIKKFDDFNFRARRAFSSRPLTCRFSHAPDARGKTTALVARAPSPRVMTKPRATPGTPPTGGGAAPRDFQDHLRASPSPTSPPLAQTLKDVRDVDDERVVLLPVDGGRGIETDAVLKWCCDNLYRDGDTFLLLHVVPRSGWRRRAREEALGYEPSEVSHQSSSLSSPRAETYPRGVFPSHRPRKTVRSPPVPRGLRRAQANAADDEAAAVWLDEAEARMRREYLPRLREFGLPEDVACFEGEPCRYFFLSVNPKP